MKRRSIIKASVLIPLITLASVANSTTKQQPFQNISDNERRIIVKELFRVHSNKKIVFRSKITKNTKTYLTLVENIYVRLDITNYTVSLNDIIKK